MHFPAGGWCHWASSQPWRALTGAYCSISVGFPSLQIVSTPTSGTPDPPPNLRLYLGWVVHLHYLAEKKTIQQAVGCLRPACPSGWQVPAPSSLGRPGKLVCFCARGLAILVRDIDVSNRDGERVGGRLPAHILILQTDVFRWNLL